MDEEHTETGVRDHLSNKDTWLRLLYMILFGIAFEIVKFVTYFVAIVQILFKLFTGDVQPRLSAFGASLATFLHQAVEFLACRSEVKPYPWSAWPLPDEPVVGAASEAATAPAAPKPERRARRKASGPASEDKIE